MKKEVDRKLRSKRTDVMKDKLNYNIYGTPMKKLVR